MGMKLFSSIALVLVAGLSVAAPTAKELLAKASADARKSGKNVLVIFHASWCGWCHKLDDFLEKTDEGKMVTNGLEVVHFTVLEDPKHKADENQGAIELMNKWGSEKAGLPFMVIIDAKTGKPVINSFAKEGDTSSNTGYPAQPAEVAHFMKMLEVGAKKINKTNREKIGAWLKANAPG
ncbi:MAG: thioredoxin fold domain-containing protein [Armatimonadetes bacterium]|nr:thioredoxin fold domain-containing protein [Armatimonadota bacterium]